jgi:1-acyl-sn-glycerol-3-phosphate acyltransferase
VNYGDPAWAFSRLWLQPITKLFTRAQIYGRERIPAGGCVLAVNHLHWVDICVVGSLSPRTVNYVTKAEAFGIPIVGWYIGLHGAIGIRRGESDREAVRRMREAARAGRMIGVFVEGTRQKTGRPGAAQPGAAMVALQEDVPVLPAAVYGTQFWTPRNFAPCSLAIGEPVRFKGLADLHARGRPPGESPPL